MHLAVDDGPPVAWEPVGEGDGATSAVSGRDAEPTSPGSPSPFPVIIDALHDGDRFPGPAPVAARADVRAAHAARRAAGTAAFARRLAEALGAPGLVRGRVARVALDFERPAGVDLRGTTRALGHPVASLLEPEARRRLLERYRDGLRALVEARGGARLTVSVRSRDGGGRPRVLAATDPVAPPTWVDPLVPRVLLERTADPFLLHALSEAVGVGPEPDDGVARLEPSALAVRSVVFDWLRYLQGRLGPKGEPLDPAGRRMWSALLDVSGLSAETWCVRACLHHGLEPPPVEHPSYEAMERRYRELAAWVEARESELVRSFLRRTDRRDHLVLEVPGAGEAIDVERLAEVLRDHLQPRSS